MSQCDECKNKNETEKLKIMDLCVQIEKDMQLLKGMQKIIESEVESLELELLEQM